MCPNQFTKKGQQENKKLKLTTIKKEGRLGKERGMSSVECKKRRLYINRKSSCWDRPSDEVTDEDVRDLLGIAE